MRLAASGILVSALGLVSQPTGGPTPGDFPIINLGYARHRPTNITTTQGNVRVAEYSNIRFAQAPVGELRFRKPVIPPPFQQGIPDGSEHGTPDCVSSASWATPFPGINGTHWGQEDCLFLDVYVPEGIRRGDRVPVIHWIYGSAFAFGSKDLMYTTLPPWGLFDAAALQSRKFIFVASNYRMGFYGWASSPHEPTMDANVGAHDGMAAVQWTKRHISKFGGDPERITVMGQSAGAAIINSFLTSYGGKGDLPFSQACILSSGIMPRRDVVSRRQAVYEAVLNATRCDSLDCLRKASPESLAEANHYLINDVNPGAGGGSFGPGVGFTLLPDGNFLPDETMILLEQGRFHKIKRVLAANTALEGMSLIGDANMPEAFPNLVRPVFPTASKETIERIASLFPYPPETPEKLAWDWLTAIVFACHSQSVANAYRNRARRYVLSVPPATHGYDALHVFFINNDTTPVPRLELAQGLQAYLIKFITGEIDHAPPRGLPGWPVYGNGFRTMDVAIEGFQVKEDPWRTICPALLEIIKDPRNGN